MIRVWKNLGYQMIFYLAALQSIDISLYEAAKVDGATALQRFFKITVPLLKPTLVFTLVMSVNAAIQVYDESVNLRMADPAMQLCPLRIIYTVLRLVVFPTSVMHVLFL